MTEGTEDTQGIDDPLVGDASTIDGEPRASSGRAHDGLLLRGDVVDRFVVLRKLGAGGMGIVYAAYDPELDRRIALKLLHEFHDTSRASEGHRRLLREAQAMAKLNHPNVVAVHDVGEHAGHVYVAMEFVRGTTLAEWCRSRPRDWEEISEAFRGAGEGLVAAHEIGLVHRDFKPDNVMIDETTTAAVGRARVMDFGLARATTKGAVQDDEFVGLAQLRTDMPVGDLTRAGSIVGTPAYMAPEQYRGGDVGTLADQFSFCVALWEALHGQRPFVAENVAALAIAITQGRITEPSSSRVPPWIRRTLLRGLSTEPDRRFPSMRALLAELARGQARARKRKLLLALGSIALIGAVLLGVHRVRVAAAIADCETAGASIREHWNDETSAEMRAQFISTGSIHAAPTADRVTAQLDTLSDTWNRTKAATCIAATVDETLAPELSARADECLDERRLQLETLIDDLAGADSILVDFAVLLMNRSWSIEACADPRRLAQRPEPLQIDIDELREIWQLFARSRTAGLARKLDEGLAHATNALERAQAVAEPRLVAEARSSLGYFLLIAGDHERAEIELSRAYIEGAKAGIPEVTYTAALRLMFLVGYLQHRDAEGLVWAKAAEVAIQAIEPTEGLHHAELLNNLGAIAEDRGRWSEAKGLYERALAIRERELGPDDHAIAVVLGNLANVEDSLGASDRAVTLFERALVITERVFGPEHPEVADILGNLAIAHVTLGDLGAARTEQMRALALRKATLGAAHPDVALSLRNLGELDRKVGDRAGAQRNLEDALAIYERAGELDTETATILFLLAELQEEAGDDAGASALAERACVIAEKNSGLAGETLERCVAVRAGSLGRAPSAAKDGG